MHLKETLSFFGRPLTIETGRLAKQAHGSAFVTLGETAVLVTVVASPTLKEGWDFLPLTVEYQERTYSAGKIPGGFFKREGRPTETEILHSRLIDRPIRPMFPKDWKYDTQIVALVLSMDKENDPAIAAMIGASAALSFSNVPFDGPIGALRIGRIDGELVVNPSFSEREDSDLDIMVAVGPQGLCMVEGSANFVPEEEVLDALVFAQEAIQPVLDMQRRMAEQLGVTKRTYEPAPRNEELISQVRQIAWEPLCEALSQKVKAERQAAITAVRESTLMALTEAFPEESSAILSAIDNLERERVRTQILDEQVRIDGRSLTEVRPITCEIGVLPRAHGSALFQRGETQVIAALTLGTAADEQRLDLLTGDTTRSFMLHYNFPPFSVGEVKMMRGPSRRDIGHGHLAERGVKPLLPEKDDDFQYTIRIVSEVLESNGSSSMATVCGSSLALMDAGVPIQCHVGGIAMGLIKEGDRVAILTDILGDEDHLGDMDFKVIGTMEGITALQMDIKCSGLTRDIMSRALHQAQEARVHIIKRMVDTIENAREDYSPYAPRMYTLQINPDRIRDLIGPGGKHIRGIQTTTGATIEVNDEGQVVIAATDEEIASRAIAMVRELTDEAVVGETYTGQVVKVVEFGAFVRILPGVEGLVHISELADEHIAQVEDVCREGDEITVKVIHIDPSNGKVRLSRRALLHDGDDYQPNLPPGRGARRDNDRRDRSGGRDDRRDRFGGRDDRRGRGPSNRN